MRSMLGAFSLLGGLLLGSTVVRAEDLLLDKIQERSSPGVCASYESPYQVLEGLNQFSVFSLQGIEAVCSDFQRAIGAFHNIRLGRMEINGGRKPLPDGNAVLTRGSLMLWHGAIKGGNATAYRNILMGNYHSDGFLQSYGAIDATQGYDRGSRKINQMSYFDEPTFNESLVKAVGGDLSQPNPLAPQLKDPITMVFKGKPKGLGYFKVSYEALKSIEYLEVDATDSGFLVIEMVDSKPDCYESFTFAEKEIKLLGATKQKNVLFYFPNARYLTIRNIKIPGSVLALTAHTRFYDGLIEGNLWVKNLIANPKNKMMGPFLYCDADKKDSGGQVNGIPFQP